MKLVNLFAWFELRYWLEIVESDGCSAVVMFKLCNILRLHFSEREIVAGKIAAISPYVLPDLQMQSGQSRSESKVNGNFIQIQSTIDDSLLTLATM